MCVFYIHEHLKTEAQYYGKFLTEPTFSDFYIHLNMKVLIYH